MIIADLRLPQKNGLQMIVDFRQSGYQGRVILISACADQVQPEDLEKFRVDRLFINPWTSSC